MTADVDILRARADDLEYVILHDRWARAGRHRERDARGLRLSIFGALFPEHVDDHGRARLVPSARGVPGWAIACLAASACIHTDGSASTAFRAHACRVAEAAQTMPSLSSVEWHAVRLQLYESVLATVLAYTDPARPSAAYLQLEAKLLLRGASDAWLGEAADTLAQCLCATVETGWSPAARGPASIARACAMIERLSAAHLPDGIDAPSHWWFDGFSRGLSHASA